MQNQHIKITQQIKMNWSRQHISDKDINYLIVRAEEAILLESLVEHLKQQIPKEPPMLDTELFGSEES